MLRTIRLMLAGALACASLAVSAVASAQERGAANVCPSRAALDAAPQLVRSGDARAIADFQQMAACHHWITFYFAAESMFKSGARDEAARWFYAGQIRSRTVAQLGPDTSAPSMIQALQYLVGQPVNEYAGGDQAKLLQAVDWAIDWDNRNPMPMNTAVSVGKSGPFGSVELNFDPAKPLHFEKLRGMSQKSFDAAYAKQREGIANLRKMIADASPEEWAARRQATGLK